MQQILRRPPTPAQPTWFLCRHSICPTAAADGVRHHFTRPADRQRHERSVHRAPCRGPPSCDLCPQGMVTQEKGKPFQCPHKLCPKGYESKAKLVRHLEEKLHCHRGSCQGCNEANTRRLTLGWHGYGRSFLPRTATTLMPGHTQPE